MCQAWHSSVWLIGATVRMGHCIVCLRQAASRVCVEEQRRPQQQARMTHQMAALPRSIYCRMCWAPQPEHRPSFDEVVQQLQLLKGAAPPDDGQAGRL